MSIVTRFAPSPTGYLHLGHAHAALFAWSRARQAPGGRFLLRIEDIDPDRCRDEFADAIQQDLAGLGLDWDGQVRRQSAHLAEYRAVLQDLVARNLVYSCFCTRASILRDIENSAHAPHAPDATPDGSAVYPGTCRALSAARRRQLIAAGTPYALRLDMARALACVPDELTYRELDQGTILCRPEKFGDAVLARKDSPASYHLCVTHDDARQGVTLVTRGMDLQPCTDLHRLIQALMGWPAPDYAHHPLLTDAQGRRLAKRDQATTLRELRQAGRIASEMRAMAGF